MTDDLEEFRNIEDLLDPELEALMNSHLTFEDRMEASYSSYVLRKARKLRGEAKFKGTQTPGLFRVIGSAGDEYRVQVLIGEEKVLTPAEDSLLPFVTCTCPNGDVLGGHPRCYHTAAALYAVAEDLPFTESTDQE